MSYGELGSGRGGFADMRLNRTSITAVLAHDLLAVEDAEGDVKGAQEHMRQEMIVEQRKVHAAEGVVTERQQSVIDMLAGMRLAGRTVEVSVGDSLETEESESRNLSGVRGEVVDFEVGSVLGRPIEPAGAVVLHIRTDDEQIVPPGRYPLRADLADYSLSELPDPDQR